MNWSALATAGLVGFALFIRGVLYAVFVFGGAITLLTNGRPRQQDTRRSAAAISLVASFLLVGANIAPTGPTLWKGSNQVTEVGVLITLIGAALALIAFASLGSSFSVSPEARTLSTQGIYKFVRHPMYLGELLMIVGALTGQAQLTLGIGTLIVIGLQIQRIRMEESLLRRTFPAKFQEFRELTAYRLIPGIW